VFDRLFLQHRMSAIALTAWACLFAKLWGAAGPPTEARSLTAFSGGHLLADPEVAEPLTRASVLAHTRAGRGGAKQPQTVLRRDTATHIVEDRAATTSWEEDPLEILKRATLVPAGGEGAVAAVTRRPQQLADAFLALGRLQSARGQYADAQHTMEHALHQMGTLGDQSALALGFITFGELELRHHRYHAAELRFEGALERQGVLSDAARVTAFSGAGWAHLMQGSLAVAEERFLTVLSLMGVPAGLAPPELAGRGPITTTAGQDGARVLAHALTGLSLTLARRVAVANGGDGDGTLQKGDAQHSRCRSLVDYAATLLRRARAARQGFSFTPEDAMAEHGLGLAELVMGLPEPARRRHRRAATAAAADLAVQSHGALHLGLVDFSSGHTEQGAQRVEELVAMAPPSSEVAEWLRNFARAHLWVPGGPAFAAWLSERASAL
jgi:hypothetical protein